MAKRLYMIFAGIALSTGIAFAQSQVTGTVVDDKGNPVIGASVRVSGTQTGSVTDLDGKFAVSAPANAQLEVTYVGMHPTKVKAGSNIRVVLQSYDKEIDEVVVVAYGTAKKQSLVGAQSNISAKQLENRPITNVSTALAGAAPGVQVTTALGQPGSSSGVMIRGFGSINASSDPLYIVDGSVYNGSLADINPQDIASVSILKDASATALYGSSAGNGVVLITTKQGKRKGSAPTLTFTTSQGITQRGQERYKTLSVNQYFPVLWQQWYNQHQFEEGMSKEQAALLANYDMFFDFRGDVFNPFAGIKTGISYDERTNTFGTTQDKTKWVDGVPQIVMPDGTLNKEITGLRWGDDLDWEKALFRTGYRGEYNLSGWYSNDKVSTFMSLGHIKEQGYRRNTEYERTSGRLNLDYNVTKWFDLGGNVSFVHAASVAPKQSSGYFNANSFHFLQGIAPFYPIHKHDPITGEYVLDPQTGKKVFDYNNGRPYSARFNPVYEGELDHSTTTRDMLNTRGHATFKIMPELKYTINAAYDLSMIKKKVRYNNIMGDQPSGLLSIEDFATSTLTFNQLLEYSKTFGEHDITVLLGHESYKYTATDLNGAKRNMMVLGLDEFSNLTNIVGLDSYTDNYRKEGYFGRLNWDYKQKYNFSASYRRDGSSRFAPDCRWGDFWAVGAGWHIGREAFMKSTSKWLDDLKLRASIGQTGNDNLEKNYYAYQTLYSFGSNNLDEGGLRLYSYADPTLRWEAQTSLDVAVEYSLFSRVYGTFEYFNKESSDLIFPYPLANSTGVTEINKNIGKIRNSGFEFDINAILVKTNDLSWKINLNGTHFTNTILRLPKENRENGIELDYQKYMEGGSIYDYYLNEYVGVDPDDGMAMYRLDKELYPNAKPLAAEGEKATLTKNGELAKKHFCGTSIPDLYGGFGTTLTWKNFELGVNFSYQLGGKTYDSGYASLMGRKLQAGSAMHVDMLKAWKQKGDITDVPRLDAGNGGRYDATQSDRFLVSSSALMLKNISLGYNLPKSWLSAVNLKGGNISIAAENLFLLSARKGLNPMGQFSGIVGAAGYAYARTLTATLTITL